MVTEFIGLAKEGKLEEAKELLRKEAKGREDSIADLLLYFGVYSGVELIRPLSDHLLKPLYNLQPRKS